MPKIPYWPVKEEIGYTPKTRFWDDFWLAIPFGVSAIKHTYNKAFNEWKNDHEYLTELSLVLNHIAFWFDDKNAVLCQVFADLWEQNHEYALTHLKGDELKYYYRTTD